MSASAITNPLLASAKSLLRNSCKPIIALLKDVLFIRTLPGKSVSSMPMMEYTRFSMNARFAVVCVCLVGLAAAVVFKMWTIQVEEHESHNNDANRLLGFRQLHIGTRGEILDYDNNLLAGNIRTKDLYITPRHIAGEDDKTIEYLPEVCEMLSRHTGVPAEEILKNCKKILDKRVPIEAASGVSKECADSIAAMNLPGVQVVKYEPLSDSPDVVLPPTNTFNILFYPKDFTDYKERDSVIMTLEDALALESGALFQEVNKVLRSMKPLRIIRRISIDKAHEITEEFNQWNEIRKNNRLVRNKVARDAVYFEESTKRVYPKDRVLSNLIGFCDTEDVGLTGVERLMNNYMKNSTSSEYILLDGTVGSFRFPKAIYDRKLNGCDVHLTIQMPIQQIVETHLAELIEEHKPKRAYAVMMNPQTGAIMAMAQYPSFSYVHREEGDNHSFHALVDGYEPGSIMKAVSVSSAMDYANLGPDSVVFCENGAWRFGGAKPLKEHGNIQFGDLTLRQVIQKSSNIGSAKAVIENMTEGQFYHYLRSYGMGAKTGLGFYPKNYEPTVFTEEARGILHAVEKWHKPDISRISIGHSIVITPFQMVQAYAAIANGGEMMQPYVIDRIVTPEGVTIPSVPIKKGQPISAITAQKIMECMCATVEKGGTATSAQVPGYRVCGKTGTAEKVVMQPNGKMGYSHTKHTTSFLGIAPVEAPAFVLLVTADEPSGKFRYGGSVCGKTFSRIAADTLRHLQIPATVMDDSNNDAKKTIGRR